MPIPYKAYRAEFFDRQLNFMLFEAIEEPEIKMDYLTLDKTSVILPPQVDVQRGWFCQISDGHETIYQGVVASVSQQTASTTVYLSPMNALFDTQIYKKKSTYNKTNLEGWIAGILRENFSVHSGVDGIVENLQGFSVTTLTATDGIALSLEDNIHSFWYDISKKAMESAGISIECEFDPQSKTISATIRGFADSPEITLESDLPNVIDRTFTLSENYGNSNKCLLINSENESQQMIFTSSDYEPPTLMTVETITTATGKTFSETASERAAEIFKKSEFNNLIELRYRQDDYIVPQIKIGQPCRIIRSGTVYHTVLTGIISKSGVKTLIFGGIRIDLTKIMKLKGVI